LLCYSFWPKYGYTYNWALIACVLILCFVSRAAHVFTMSNLANCGRKTKITFKMQIVMWFAGLRGAIAFALALNIPGDNRPVLLTAALSVIIFTTIVCGGLTEKLVAKLGLKRDPMMGSFDARSGAVPGIGDTHPGNELTQSMSVIDPAEPPPRGLQYVISPSPYVY
jgi:NhaP-type Na+/H+ and K+/H+ antiporter